MCECNSCKMNKRIENAYDALTEEVKSIIDDLRNELLDDSMEIGYYQSVVEGTWPNSDEIIRLARAHKTICLTSDGAKTLLEAIENPPPVNDKLKDAAKKYKDSINLK